MMGRRRLRSGDVRVYPDHRCADAVRRRELLKALEVEFGPFTPFARLEATRVVSCRMNLEASERALLEARELRASGKGRRPSPQRIERLARRQGLDDGSYSAALDKLRELCSAKRRTPSSPAELLAAMGRERDD
jgi:hypothetical protein